MTTGVEPISAPARAANEVRAERSLQALVTQSLVLTGRQLAVLFRDRATVLQILFIPALTMLMFKVVLGDAVGSATGQNSVYGTVPLVILVSAMFGSMASAVRLNKERGTGLLGRLYVLPIHRAADLVSRLLCEVVRILITTTMLLLAGMAIGFRFTQGVLPAVGIYCVALMFGIAYSMFVLAVAVNFRPSVTLVPMLSLLSSLLMFFNSGFSPLEAYPTWLQPVVEYQPLSPAIETMRALAAGGPIAANLVAVVIWVIVILAACTWPALKGYRRAATSR